MSSSFTRKSEMTTIVPAGRRCSSNSSTAAPRRVSPPLLTDVTNGLKLRYDSRRRWNGVASNFIVPRCIANAPIRTASLSAIPMYASDAPIASASPSLSSRSGNRIDQRGDLDLAIGAVGSQHQFVEPRERVPVEKAQIVAGRVLLEIFGFDSESLDSAERALAGADRPRALDAQHQAVELAQKLRLERARLEHDRQPILSPREPT